MEIIEEVAKLHGFDPDHVKQISKTDIRTVYVSIPPARKSSNWFPHLQNMLAIGSTVRKTRCDEKYSCHCRESPQAWQQRLMAEAFIKGAKEAGHIVNKYGAAFSKINGCRTCDTCWSKGKPCSFEDDFNEKFISLFEQADTLILCMPLYFYGFPSKVQATFEKLYSLLGENSPIKIKVENAALLMCAGESGFDIFDGAIGTYQQLCRGLHWKDCGMILARNILEKGAITKTDYLKKCELLGKNI